jgi:hypothetical protein
LVPGEAVRHDHLDDHAHLLRRAGGLGGETARGHLREAGRWSPRTTNLGPVLLDAFRRLFTDGTYAGVISRYHLEEVAVTVPVLDMTSVSADSTATPTTAPKSSGGPG